jgi:O-antigen ligase
VTSRPGLGVGLDACATLVALGFADGGVFPRSWRLTTIAFCALAAAALIGRPRVAPGRLELAFVAALAGAAGWTALSAAWSEQPASSLLAAERSAAYAALALAAVLLVDRAEVPALLGGVVAGITIVCAYSLGEYLFARPPLDPFEGALLHRPLGYANALGIFAAVGALVAAGLALRTRLWLAPLGVLLPVLALTSSRGAWLACAAGVVALVLVGLPLRPATVGLVGAAVVVAVAAVVVVSGASGNRGDYWRVAWQQYRESPLLGGGAGTFGDYWLVHGTEGFTRTAHNHYLQSLSELGPLGLALAVAALALPLAGLRARGDGVVAAAGGAYVAFLVHLAVDWDWELPAAAVAGLLPGTALLVATRSRPVVLAPAVRAALVAAVAALGLLAAYRLATGPIAPFAS